MPHITAITAARRHPGRFDVAVDGEQVATLSLETLERLHLAVGRSVDGLLEAMAAAAAQLRVYDRALTMLAARARSSAELARLLVRKGEAKADVDLAITRLEEQGLLNDTAFAESFTRSRVLGAKHSRRRVQQDLARKGVPRTVGEAAIETVFAQEGVDQREVVEAAARKKLRSLRGVEPMVRRRRLYAFLARRGYDADDVRSAMAALGEELDAAGA
jgi:regulatory protein